MFPSKSHRPLRLGILLGAALALASCSSSRPSADQTNTLEPGKSGGVLSNLLQTTKPVSVPEGTPIHVTLDQTLASNQNRSGDEFDASVSEPVVVEGRTVIPRGARVRGRVIEARESGRLETPARIRVALRSVEVSGKTYEIETGSITRIGPSHKKRNLEMIGGGAGLGALIGGIAGGGKGALIGGAAGAGAGTAGAALTGKKDVAIRAETPLTFRLVQPVTIPVKG